MYITTDKPDDTFKRRIKMQILTAYTNFAQSIKILYITGTLNLPVSETEAMVLIYYLIDFLHIETDDAVAEV